MRKCNRDWALKHFDKPYGSGFIAGLDAFEFMITIDKAEALARLSDKPVIEVQFECRPNTGVTHVYDVQREGAVEIINNKAATVYESGIHAQERNMGLHVGFVHKEHGPGLFVPRNEA